VFAAEPPLANSDPPKKREKKNETLPVTRDDKLPCFVLSAYLVCFLWYLRDDSQCEQQQQKKKGEKKGTKILYKAIESRGRVKMQQILIVCEVSTNR
jgi:hypothetical protein